MKKKLLTGFGLMALVALSPAVAFASNHEGIPKLISTVTDLVGRLVPLVIGLALLVFLWGVLSYALSKEDGGKEAAKGYMLWGLIALFVMVSVWGLVKILQETIGVKSGGTVVTPKIGS